MSNKFLALKIVALAVILGFTHFAHAWPIDNKIDKAVKPNQNTVLFKLFLYDPSKGCISLPAPQATAEGAVLGKISTRTGKQKLPPNLQACGKDFDAEYVEWVYSAGAQLGIDKFKIFYHDGQNLIPINVSVNINGQAIIENNNEVKNATNDNRSATQKPINLPTNPLFDKIKVGSSFTYNFENKVTNKNGKLVFNVSEKTEKEFVSVVGDSYIVYNPNFERVKLQNWTRNGRSCDGIIYPFEDNKKIKFSYNGIYQKDDLKQSRDFHCERKITGIKTINFQGSPVQGWAIENTEQSKRPDGGLSVFQFNGTFSEELGAWLEVFISERVDNRLIMNIEWKLLNTFIPESEYQIKTTICSGNCELANENQKASVVDPKKYKTKSDCQKNLDEFQKAVQTVPAPTSFIYSCIEIK